MALTVHRAELELDRLDAQIEALRERQQKLQTFIDLAKQLEVNGSTPTTNRPVRNEGPRPEAVRRGNATAEAAYKVLKRVEQMHIDDLVSKMHASGWAGTGDEAGDKNACYAAMHRLPGLFNRRGNGFWSVKKAGAE